MPIEKTKVQLLEEIEQKNQEIEQLKKEMENLERYKAYEDMANEMRAMYQSYINAGFDEDQAMNLLNATLNLCGDMLTHNLGRSIKIPGFF